MKKLVFVLGVTFLLFAGCGTKYYTVLITNKSEEKTVSYTYNGSSDTLAPNEERPYEVEAYTRRPENIKDEYGITSIDMERDGDHFTFKNATPIIFYVVNTLPVDVTIKADNYIWDKNNNSSELLASAKEERTDELFIYTENPKFTTTSEYPVKFEWDIIYEKDDSGEPLLDDFGKPKKKNLSLIIR